MGLPHPSLPHYTDLEVDMFQATFTCYPLVGIVGEETIQQIKPVVREVRKSLPKIVEWLLCKGDLWKKVDTTLEGHHIRGTPH